MHELKLDRHPRVWIEYKNRRGTVRQPYAFERKLLQIMKTHGVTDLVVGYGKEPDLEGLGVDAGVEIQPDEKELPKKTGNKKKGTSKLV